VHLRCPTLPVQDDVSLNLHLESSVAESVPIATLSSPTRALAAPHSEPAHSSHISSGTFLTVVGHLGRLSVHVSSRTASEFWPPADVAPQPSSVASLAVEHSLLKALLPSQGVMVGEERPLISIVTEGALLRYSQVPLPCLLCPCLSPLALRTRCCFLTLYSTMLAHPSLHERSRQTHPSLQATGTMAVDLRLQRFVIEDCLVGPINPRMRFLSRSFTTDDPPTQTAPDSTAGCPPAVAPPSVDPDVLSAFATTPRDPPSTPLTRMSQHGAAMFHTPSLVESSKRTLSARDGEDSEDMQSACSVLHSGQFDSQVSLALDMPTPAAAVVMPLAQVVRNTRPTPVF
jgi:hypothetical protein